MITRIHKLMTKNLITVPSGTDLRSANLLMREKRIRHLPIVDDEQNIIGVLSQRDSLAVRENENIPVDWVMSSPVKAVNEDLSVRKAVFEMLSNKISSLLVTTDDDEVIGIVTTDDLLWYLGHLLEDEKDEKSKLVAADRIQAIGTVANRLSEMGI